MVREMATMIIQKYGICVLHEGQRKESLVLYISRKAKNFERNYEPRERGLACVVWGIC